MIQAHLYIVAYDISSPRRWRKVIKLVQPFCQRGQLSVFVCRSTPARIERLERDMRKVMHSDHDRLMILDVGQADRAVERMRLVNPAADLGQLSAAVII